MISEGRRTDWRVIVLSIAGFVAVAGLALGGLAGGTGTGTHSAPRPEREIDERAMPVVWKVRDHRYSTVTEVTSRCDRRAREQSCEARESQWPRAPGAGFQQ